MENREVQVRQYQVIKKRNGIFGKSTEIIFRPEHFKTPEQVEQETAQKIQKKGGSFFRSTKITHVNVYGNNNKNIFKF